MAKRVLDYDADIEILKTLERLKDEIDLINSNLDYVTDPVLIDSYIFELKAVHMRYQYYMGLCKERGITFSLSGGEVCYGQ